MKWVGIDGNEANVGNRVGSNVYAFELLSALARWLEKSRAFRVRVYVTAPPREDMPAESEWWQYKLVPNAPMWTQWRLPVELKKDAADLAVFFSPGHYVPSVSPVPVIASIMDVAYEFFPEQFRTKDLWQLKLLTRWSAYSSDHLVAISESTKRDIQEVYGRSAQEISVLYPAMPKSEKIPASEMKKLRTPFDLDQPYILYVGTIQPRKNLVRLIGAFEHVKKTYPDVQLVIAGKVGWLADETLARRESSPYKQDIRLLGYLSDAEKLALIHGSRLLALVGLYEGFGIPPLEAIESGVMPVVSNTSSLPEVVGPDGITVNPEDELSIAAGIQSVLEMPAPEYEKKVAKLQEYAKRFRWSASAETLGKLLQSYV